jgi:hypothetical protein
MFRSTYNKQHPQTVNGKCCVVSTSGMLDVLRSLCLLRIELHAAKWWYCHSIVGSVVTAALRDDNCKLNTIDCKSAQYSTLHTTHLYVLHNASSLSIAVRQPQGPSVPVTHSYSARWSRERHSSSSFTLSLPQRIVKVRPALHCRGPAPLIWRRLRRVTVTVTVTVTVKIVTVKVAHGL